jgi:hypothetical protein
MCVHPLRTVMERQTVSTRSIPVHPSTHKRCVAPNFATSHFCDKLPKILEHRIVILFVEKLSRPAVTARHESKDRENDAEPFPIEQVTPHGPSCPHVSVVDSHPDALRIGDRIESSKNSAQKRASSLS